MKKIIMLCSFAGFLVSCHHNAPNLDKFEVDPSSGWVYFGTTVTSAPGNNDTQIPLVLQAYVNETGVDITYKIEAVMDSIPNDGINDNVPNEVIGTFTDENAIPAGELTGFLNVNLAETSAGNCYQLIVTLVNTSKEDVQVGLAEDGVEDEVQYPIEHIVSAGPIADAYYGTSYFQDTPILVFDPILTPVDGKTNVFNINTAWGFDFLPTLDPQAESLPYDAILTIKKDGTVIITGNAGYATGGEGQYNACTGEISYTLTQAYFTDTTITFDVVLTPVLQ